MCRLRRQALAAFGAATGKDLLSAGGQHALAEAVAALAHEAAWLIGAFHGRLRQVWGRLAGSAGKRKMIVYPWLKSTRGPEKKALPGLSAARSCRLIGGGPAQVNGLEPNFGRVTRAARPSGAMLWPAGPAADCEFRV